MMGDQVDREPRSLSSDSSELPIDRLPVPGEPSEVNSPIFVVGCHRSGTSVLRRILDSHPRISSGPEEASVFWLAKDDDDLGRRRRESYGVAEEEWLGMVRNVVETFQLRYAESAGKTRWALKLPQNSLIIGFLEKLYPDCQIVHIVRNPRDVIASNRRMYGAKKDTSYGERWVHYVRSAETAGAALGPDRYRTIRYEDLLANPEVVLRDLIEWLGEPWSEDVLHVGGRTHKYPARVKRDDELEDREVRQADLHRESLARGTSDRCLIPLGYVWLKGNDLVKKFGYEIHFVRGKTS